MLARWRGRLARRQRSARSQGIGARQPIQPRSHLGAWQGVRRHVRYSMPLQGVLQGVLWCGGNCGPSFTSPCVRPPLACAVCVQKQLCVRAGNQAAPSCHTYRGTAPGPAQLQRLGIAPRAMPVWQCATTGAEHGTVPWSMHITFAWWDATRSVRGFLLYIGAGGPMLPYWCRRTTAIFSPTAWTQPGPPLQPPSYFQKATLFLYL